MRAAIVDIELFTTLLKYGEVRISDFMSEEILSEERKAIEDVLAKSNPVYEPSRYLIVFYEQVANEQDCIDMRKVKRLMWADEAGEKQFQSQFRNDLVIEKAGYSDLFYAHVNVDLQKSNIDKGIRAFRYLCGFNDDRDFPDETEIIFQAMNARLQYHHHYMLPEECCKNPYILMLCYDRYAPYNSGLIGYFCDVVEILCYYDNPSLKYVEGEGIATRSQIWYKRLSLLADKASSAIYDAIKDEQFALKCNEIFGGNPWSLLIPYIFFLLRDRIRSERPLKDYIERIKKKGEDFEFALDKASIYVGGFFGYERFYDDYYSALKLPILKSANGEIPNLEIHTPEIVNDKDNDDNDSVFESFNVHGIKEKIIAYTKKGRSQKKILSIVEKEKHNKDFIDLLYKIIDTANDYKKLLGGYLHNNEEIKAINHLWEKVIDNNKH